MNRFVLFSLMVLPIITVARPMSSGVGNGGHVFICPERVDKVITLDSNVAKKNGLTLNLHDPSEEEQTWHSMVMVAVKRLAQKDQSTAALLEEYALEIVEDFLKYKSKKPFRPKAVYLGPDVNVTVFDSKHISIPNDCNQELLQLVIQRAPEFKFELRYHVNEELWNRMSVFQQSMMILHEAWYRIMIENGATDSRAARYMNGLVASNEFEDLSFSEYLDELQSTELRKYKIITSSNFFKAKEVYFDLKEDSLKGSGEEVCASGFRLNTFIKETFRPWNRGQRYLENLKFQKVCFKNSQISRLVIFPKTANSDIAFRLPFYQMYISSATNKTPTIFFHPNGKISHFSGLKFSLIMEMYYICNGETTYKPQSRCEKGPRIDHSTEIKNPKEFRFDTNEEPIGIFVR